MNYQKLCDDIIGIDTKVRTAFVFDEDSKALANTTREGLDPYLTADIVKLTVDNAFMRWHTRLNLRDWIGVPIYAVTKYEKLKRFSFFLDSQHLVLLVTTELDINGDDFAECVLDMVKSN